MTAKVPLSLIVCLSLLMEQERSTAFDCLSCLSLSRVYCNQINFANDDLNIRIIIVSIPH